MSDREPSNPLVDACLQEILQGSEFPALARQIQDVLRHLENDQISLEHLTKIVLRDYSLTLKVLRTANTSHFNRWGTGKLSASHAMALLGSRTLRELACGLLLFEQYHQRFPMIKPLLLLALLTANHARAAAEASGYPDPEAAYLCGMFRSLGEVLIACHFPSRYQVILTAVADGRATPRDAPFRELGFGYEELGAAMAEHWGLTTVGSAMRWKGGADQLGALTAFAHDLTTLVYREEGHAGDRDIAALTRRYARSLPLRPDRVEAVLEAGIAETRETAFAMKVPIDDLRLKRQAAIALGRSVPDADDLAVERAVHAVDGASAMDTGFDLGEVLRLILDEIRKAGHFDHAVFGLVNPERTGIQGRFGVGKGSEELVGRFRFSLKDQHGTLSTALSRRQDLFASPERGMTPADLRVARQLGAAAFGVLPLTVRDALVGCIYVDHVDPAPPPDARCLNLLSRLRDQGGRALDLRQAASSEAEPRQWSADEKMAAVLRLLRGDPTALVSKDTGATEADLEGWRQAFLAGARSQLGGGAG